MSTPISGSKAAKAQALKSLAEATLGVAVAYPKFAEYLSEAFYSGAVEDANGGTSIAGTSKAKKSKKTKGLLAAITDIVGDAIHLDIPKGWPIVQTESGRFWVNVPLTGAKRPIAKGDCNRKGTKSKVVINRTVYRKPNWTRPKSITIGDTFPVGYLVVTTKSGNANATEGGTASTSEKSKSKGKKSSKKTSKVQPSAVMSRHINKHHLTMSDGVGPGFGGCTCGTTNDCIAVKNGFAENDPQFS